MKGLTAEERGDLAEAMLPVAARLSTIAHGDGGPEDIASVLNALDPHKTRALIVVLAGLIDPDRPLGALLGWVDFDENGIPADADVDSQQTLREIAEAFEAEHDDWDQIDEVAVRRYLAGHRPKLHPKDRLEAIRRALADDMSLADLDRLGGHTIGGTCKFLKRQKEAAALRGEELDINPPQNTAVPENVVVAIRVACAEGTERWRLANRYGLSERTIDKITCGDMYPQFGGPLRQKSKGAPAAARAALGTSPKLRQAKREAATAAAAAS